ncbi:hypothetical protein PG997_002332 [Apiospora hydei]|uniref:2EXR domain-containing protein n=1 Tax=Apiospora hydei TaxID=1337664 RepID=A0ABR1X916_9PEZI
MATSHATAADPTPETLPIFHRFPALPPELRDAIWTSAAHNAFELYHYMTEQNPRLFCSHVPSAPERYRVNLDARLDFKAAEVRLIEGLMALLLTSKESNLQSMQTIRGYQEPEDRQLPLLGLWGTTLRGSLMRQLIMPRNDIFCMQHSLKYFASPHAGLGRFAASTGRRLRHIMMGIGRVTAMNHQQIEALLQRVPRLETLYVDVSLLRFNHRPRIIPINPCQLHHYDFKRNMTWLCDLPSAPPSEHGEESVDDYGVATEDEVVEGAGDSKGSTQVGERAVDYHRILRRLQPGGFQSLWTLCAEAKVTVRFIARTGWHAERFHHEEI